MMIGIRDMASSTLALVSALTVLGAISPIVSAQETEPLLDTLEGITERRSGDYYKHRTSLSQFNFITGLGGFADQRVNRDAAATSGAYQELLILQTQSTPTVRVPDLPNPYTTSVQLLPASQFNSRVVGSELNFEPLPRR